MKTNPNDNAYPRKSDLYSEATGMTKRELFAAMAMQGLLAHKSSLFHKENGNGQLIALGAVGYADALIAELNKESK